MSNLVAGIIGGCAGLWLGILMISIVSVTRKVEQENVIYKEGYTAGYKMGYTAGDRDGYRAGIKRMSAFGRVDVAPGPDSIRPRVEINKPITGLRVSEIDDDYIKRFLVDMFGKETEVRHD